MAYYTLGQIATAPRIRATGEGRPRFVGSHYTVAQVGPASGGSFIPAAALAPYMRQANALGALAGKRGMRAALGNKATAEATLRFLEAVGRAKRTGDASGGETWTYDGIAYNTWTHSHPEFAALLAAKDRVISEVRAEGSKYGLTAQDSMPEPDRWINLYRAIAVAKAAPPPSQAAPALPPSPPPLPPALPPPQMAPPPAVMPAPVYAPVHPHREPSGPPPSLPPGFVPSMEYQQPSGGEAPVIEPSMGPPPSKGPARIQISERTEATREGAPRPKWLPWAIGGALLTALLVSFAIYKRKA